MSNFCLQCDLVVVKKNGHGKARLVDGWTGLVQKST